MANLDWAVGGFGMPGFGPWAVFMAILVVWSLFWKGLALWKSARSGSTIWFLVILLINTAGILEILYLFVFSKGFKITMDEDKKSHTESTHHENKEESTS